MNAVPLHFTPLYYSIHFVLSSKELQVETVVMLNMVAT